MRPALLLTFLALFGVVASGAEVSSPLDGVLKLAASQSRDDRVRALRLLKAAARPGNTAGDVATYHHAELCLRFHREGERGALGNAKESFVSLQKNAGSRWGLRGKIGLLRVAALEGRRDEAVRGFDRLISASTRDERSVEAAYYLGLIRAEKRTDAAELRKAMTSARSACTRITHRR